MEKRRLSALVFLAFLLAALFSASIFFGSVPLSVRDVFAGLSGRESASTASLLVRAIRLPRAVGALFAGMGLSCAGVILQCVMNNSMASPNTIGVNSGAGLGVMLALCFFSGSAGGLSLAAFLGALAASMAIYSLAVLSDSSRTTVILAGITVSSFLNAATNTVKLIDSDIAVDMASFLVGSLSGLTMTKIGPACVLVAVGCLLTLIFSPALNILSFGDEMAYGLGINVIRTRLVFLVLASLLAGSVVSYAGLLSFVGLIVPHICRRLFGAEARGLLISCFLLGPIFVLAADLAGRLLFAPFELPAGILTAFIGGPFFLFLLLKRKGGRRLYA